jgi:diguanylate cyclase (GGDEF)-like protein
MGPAPSCPSKRRDALLPIAAAVALLLGCYVAWQAFRLTPGHRAVVGDVFFVAAWTTAIVSARAAARRCSQAAHLRAAWRTVAFASLTCLAGSLVQTVSDLGKLKLGWAVTDLPSLMFYPVLLMGLRRLPTVARSPAERLRLLLDVAVVAIGASAVLLYLVVGLTDVHARSSATASVLFAPQLLGDIILLICVPRIWLGRPPASSRAAMRLLGAGLMVYVAGNLSYGYATVHSTYHRGDQLDAVTMVAIALLAMAGAAQGSVAGNERLRSGAEQPYLSRLPYFAVAMGFGLLILAQQDGGGAGAAVTVAVALMIALVLVRQFLAQRDLLNAQVQLSHQSLHDALTGLPNRVLVADRAENLLARARRGHVLGAALYVDLDGFKDVNDTFGHAAGDELLETVAARLSSVARGGDTVGRISGDEFVVLLEGVSMDAGPELVAERVLDVLRQPVALSAAGARPHTMTASIGIAVAQQGSAEELFRDADCALYEAKRAGRNRFVVFESQMRALVKDRLELGLDLKDALEQEQLHLLYQPMFDLQTNAVTGTEALIRWRHPTRGMIPPDEFIPLAEQTGMILAIGRWVLDNACRQAAEWRARGNGVELYVNVSTRQLERDDLIDDVRRALRGSGLEPEALTLEVTETGLMNDPHSVTERLGGLKSLGVRIAIDDFGTGYSSLAYLAQFPADILKIDRSFVSGIAATEESSLALLHTLIQLGKSLGMVTLGEGIENHDQLERLRSERCELGQGYLFAEPLTREAFEQFLLDHRLHGERERPLPTNAPRLGG